MFSLETLFSRFLGFPGKQGNFSFLLCFPVFLLPLENPVLFIVFLGSLGLLGLPGKRGLFIVFLGSLGSLGFCLLGSLVLFFTLGFLVFCLCPSRPYSLTILCFTPTVVCLF